MKKSAVFMLFFLLFSALPASDFIYQIQFRQADDQERDWEELEKDQIKIIETIFRDNFNPSGFTQINPFLLKNTKASLAESDITRDDSDFIKSRIVMNKLNITHSLLGLVSNMGNVYYVRLFFSEVTPSFRSIAVGNFDCAISDSLAKCSREFAEQFAKNPAIIEEGKRANTVVHRDEEKEKPRLIYGFLNVFPSDIGRYKEIPKQIIKKINATPAFKDPKCEEWRVPTENEVALLAGERLIIKAEDYITDKKSIGRLRLVADCKETKDTGKEHNLLKYRQPEVIYGFLKVFPKDIGEYNKRPTEIVEKINSSSEEGIYGCRNWRIPTENEVALLASRGIIIKAEEYLSADGKDNGALRLVADMPGYESEPENQENEESEPEKETENEGKESKPDEKSVSTAEQKEIIESESDSKLEQGSKSKQEDGTTASASKTTGWGCSVDIL